MEDLLNNKKLFKIMWANQKEIIWDLQNEVSIPLNNDIYNELNKFIDINVWIKEYSISYGQWLNGENSDIYNIQNKLNQQITSVLPQINNHLKDSIIFYWFDVDRDSNLNFEWKFCPISGDKLKKINAIDNNSLICEKCFLVLPTPLHSRES